MFHLAQTLKVGLHLKMYESQTVNKQAGKTPDFDAAVSFTGTLGGIKVMITNDSLRLLFRQKVNLDTRYNIWIFIVNTYKNRAQCC